MFIFLSIMFACGSNQAPTEVTAPNATAEAPAAAKAPSPADQAVLVEVLKTADAADGTEDKVAHKCAGCALAMDGKAENAITVEGTTLHFCSSMCKANFGKDITGNLLKLVN